MTRLRPLPPIPKGVCVHLKTIACGIILFSIKERKILGEIRAHVPGVSGADTANADVPIQSPKSAVLTTTSEHVSVS